MNNNTSYTTRTPQLVHPDRAQFRSGLKSHTRRRRATLLAGTALLATSALIASVIPANALSGVDISSHQHPGNSGINWSSVKNSGQSFVFVKATEGVGYVNPYYLSDINAANATGLVVGSYHFARPQNDPRAEARYYAAEYKKGPAGQLPPALDLEDTGGKGPDALNDWVAAWVDEIKIQTGRTPIFYSYLNFIRYQMGNTNRFSNLPLWLAAYQDTPPNPLPGGWTAMTFWQRSSSGSVAGINTRVDMNNYYGDDASLRLLATTGTNLAGGVTGGIASIPGVPSELTQAAQAIDALKNLNIQIPNAEAILVPAAIIAGLIGLASGAVTLNQLFATVINNGLGLDVAAVIRQLAEAAMAQFGLPVDALNQLQSGQPPQLDQVLGLLAQAAGIQ